MIAAPALADRWAAALAGQTLTAPAAAATSARPDTANLILFDLRGVMDVRRDKMCLLSGAPARALGGHPCAGSLSPLPRAPADLGAGTWRPMAAQCGLGAGRVLSGSNSA